MKSSDPVKGRPASVGIGGRGANSSQEIRIGIPSMAEGYEAPLSTGKGEWMKMSL